MSWLHYIGYLDVNIVERHRRWSVLSDLLGIGSILSALVSGGTSIGNFSLQQQAQDYAKWAQTETWRREDSAVQRRMADLKAAGINPMMAAGSAAQTSAPVRIDTPQMEDFGGNMQATIQQLAGLSQMRANIAKTEAETAYIEQQRNNAALQEDWLSGSLSDRLTKLGLEKDQLKLSVELATATNPTRIEREVAELNKIGLESDTEKLRQANLEMDTKLKEATKGKMTQEALVEAQRLIREKIAAAFDKYNATVRPSFDQIEFISKRILAGAAAGSAFKEAAGINDAAKVLSGGLNNATGFYK